nr:transposase [Leptotrichia trevisanii]
MKWNPHVHAIVSLGGFNKNLEFRKMRYFNVDTIAGQWKYHVLKIIENGSYPNRKIEKAAKNTAAKLYKENKRFSLTLAMVILTAQKVLSNILDDTLHVLPLLNTRLLTLLTRRSLSFLTTWLMIKRKLALLCLLRHLFPIF